MQALLPHVLLMSNVDDDKTFKTLRCAEKTHTPARCYLDTFGDPLFLPLYASFKSIPYLISTKGNTGSFFRIPLFQALVFVCPNEPQQYPNEPHYFARGSLSEALDATVGQINSVLEWLRNNQPGSLQQLVVIGPWHSPYRKMIWQELRGLCSVVERQTSIKTFLHSCHDRHRPQNFPRFFADCVWQPMLRRHQPVTVNQVYVA